MYESSHRPWFIFQLCASTVPLLLRIWPFTGYEGTDPDPNGDGRAQCAVGSDLPDVTVYADDGSVYKVGSNEVSTPSPDYQGKGFFNDTFYPLGGSGSPGGGGPDVGPAYFDFCGTGPAPNVNENDSEASMTGTNTPIPSSKSDNNSVSSEISTSTASVRSSSPTVPFPTDTRTGDHSHTSGILPTGSGYHTPSISTPVPFTGDASSQKGRLGFFAFLSGISMMVVFWIPLVNLLFAELNQQWIVECWNKWFDINKVTLWKDKLGDVHVAYQSTYAESGLKRKTWRIILWV